LSLAYDAPIQGPRHRRLRNAERGTRAALTVAEALRSRFPLRTETGPGGGRAAISVAEALASRFPPAPRPPAQSGPAPSGPAPSGPRPSGPAPSGPGRPGRPALPRRIRGISLPAAARRAEPSASPELLSRILDGLQRL
jgi:hypothetical protein